MKKTDLAYVAGIVDGEGCITIAHKWEYKRGTESYSLLISLHSTDEWLCQFLRNAFGGYVGLDQRKARPHHLPAWRWQVTGKYAYELLRVILPYLHLKRPQAELAIKFQEAKMRRGHRRGRTGMTAEERVIEEAQHILMKEAKKKLTSQ